jgi:hypothetical protein
LPHHSLFSVTFIDSLISPEQTLNVYPAGVVTAVSADGNISFAASESGVDKDNEKNHDGKSENSVLSAAAAAASGATAARVDFAWATATVTQSKNDEGNLKNTSAAAIVAAAATDDVSERFPAFAAAAAAVGECDVVAGDMMYIPGGWWRREESFDAATYRTTDTTTDAAGDNGDRNANDNSNNNGGGGGGDRGGAHLSVRFEWSHAASEAAMMAQVLRNRKAEIVHTVVARGDKRRKRRNGRDRIY